MRYFVLVAVFALLLTSALALPKSREKIFDGKSMKGWRLMAVHGGQGGIWEVKDGLLVGDQDKDHKGGLIGTERKYSDVEVDLEFQADYPVDSGLFLRVREDGMGYQVTIDYRDKGSVGSIYAPGAGGFLVENAEWTKAYRQEGWNTLKARIEGEPAHITVWLNGVKLVDFTDTKQRYPREGYIGLQVHGGEGSWGKTSKVRYRNIYVTELR